MKELPKLKARVYTEKYCLTLDSEMKQKLDDLKWKDRVNVQEWMRQILRKELAILKKSG